MKKLLTILAVLALASSLAACTPKEDNEEKKENTPVTNQQAPEKDMRGIIGSHYTDIKLSLKDVIPEGDLKSAPEEAKAVFASSCISSVTNPDTGTSLDYSMTMDSSHQIIGAVFGASRYVGVTTNEEFLSEAKPFLAFCASMPCDLGDPNAAKAWVENSIATLQDNVPVNTVFGDASFELRATSSNGEFTTFTLEIRKSLPEE